MAKILTTCDEIEFLPNGTLTLYKDTNDLFSLILKDIDLSENIEISNLVYYYTNSFLVIALKLSSSKIYSTTLYLSNDTLKFIKNLKNSFLINTIFFSNNENLYPVKNVHCTNIDFKDIKNIKNQDKILDYIFSI